MTDVLKLSDEILMAYADGELSAAGRRRVERLLAGDGDARERLARFEASADATRAAFDGIATEPVPQRLVEAVRGPFRDPGSPPRKPALGERLAMLLPRPAAPFGGTPAWVATVALVFGLGLGLGYVAAPKPPADPLVEVGPVPPGTGLHRALEASPSGRDTALDRGTFTAIVSFRDRGGHVCREFEVAGDSPAAGLRVGLACRAPTARWAVEFLTAGGPAPQRGEARHAPASADLHEAVDAYVNRLLGDEGPLSADDEAALIRNGWQAPVNPGR